MSTQAIITLIAAVISATSAIIALTALRLNKKIFQRQHIFNLRAYWDKFPGLDPAAPIDDDVIIQAAHVLDLTATMWNHDVIDKIILHESYWSAFQNIYETLFPMMAKLPRVGQSPNQLLGDDIRRAYDSMKQYAQRKGKGTRLFP